MKFYKCVTAVAEENNYKKGVNRLDTGSGYYRASKKLNILASIWLMVFQFGLIFGGTTSLLIYTKNAKNLDMPLYIVTCIAFAAVAVSLYLIKRRLHAAALVLSLAAVFAQLTRIHRNDMETVNEFLNKGYINSSRFWMYFVPGILVCLFTLIICLIGIKTRLHFRKDYKAAMEKMFTAYTEEHPGVSDVEWTAHLEELDAAIEEKEAAQAQAEKALKQKKKEDKKKNGNP